MIQTHAKHIKVTMLVVATFFSVMIYSGSANADDAAMEANLSELAELMSKWSKQLGAGKMEPKAQEKLAELLSETSRLLKELSAKKGDSMNMEHRSKIKEMKTEWDPFDTYGRM